MSTRIMQDFVTKILQDFTKKFHHGCHAIWHQWQKRWHNTDYGPYIMLIIHNQKIHDFVSFFKNLPRFSGNGPFGGVLVWDCHWKHLNIAHDVLQLRCEVDLSPVTANP